MSGCLGDNRCIAASALSRRGETDCRMRIDQFAGRLKRSRHFGHGLRVVQPIG